MMTDVLFSLSFSLNWRKEKSIGIREKFAANEEERERRTRLLYTNVYENFGKKKANLKRVPFSLFFSLFQRRRERMNQRQQQEQHLLYTYKYGGERFFFFFFLLFFAFFAKVVGTPNKNSLAFLCVCVSLCRRRRRLLFFFFEPKTQHCETIYARTKTRESFLLDFCSTFARLLLDFFSLSLSHSLSLSDEEF